MNYKEYILKADNPEDASTEIMYEIASSRADKVDVIRIDILNNINDRESNDFVKLFKTVARLLRSMKQKGSIQFFATQENIRLGTTEAVFLQNKYPELFPIGKKTEDSTFILIKI